MTRASAGILLARHLSLHVISLGFPLHFDIRMVRLLNLTSGFQEQVSQDSKHHCINFYQASACITVADVALAEASHVANSKSLWKGVTERH